MKILIGLLVLAAGIAFGDAGDPPSRVARLNYLSGSVSFQPAGVDDWTPATLNYPVSAGDQLWIDANSRAEMHVGSTTIHIDSSTASSFLNLDDRTVQMRLSQGSIYLRIRNLADDEVYEIDTPNGAISLLRTGSYRIDADPDRQMTTITVYGGQAEVTAAGSAFQVHARESGILTGSDSPARESRAAGPPDNFDYWYQERDNREDSQPAPRYVSREMPGYEDLDANGSWRDDPDYGPVWAPRVSAVWAPYHDGHWRWIEPWGWTWIDDAPWGFAPFHYGRWAYARNSWFWVPGPVVARPVYAPALVAFVGGNQWSASIAIGGGGGVAWFPLGPREIYRPAYRVSPAYVNRVNVVNVTHVTNVTTVTNVRYVNQTVPGAVTVVSRTDFTTARPVSRAAIRVPPGLVASAPVAGTAPEVAPRRESLLTHSPDSRVAHPPAAAFNRTVITKRTPPPAPVPFSARQSALDANPGQPVDTGTLNRLRQSSPAPRTQVRQAAPAPAVVQPAPVYRATPPQVRTESPSMPRPNIPERPSEMRREQPRQQQPERVQPERSQQERRTEPPSMPRSNSSERPSEMRREQPRQQQQERVQPERSQPQAAPPDQKREERRTTREERSNRQEDRREKEK
ncbi:MAG: putative prolin-rich exported protein [Bryobacterales bacterium]|nr:putative prolin-rich exported protein [Bryobacterales bacterium]